MPPIEEYLEHVDALAQDVVNAWGSNTQAGNALTGDFEALLDKACRYRTAKSVADNRREFDILSELDAAEERSTRQEFAEAYKVYWEKKHHASA